MCAAANRASRFAFLERARRFTDEEVVLRVQLNPLAPDLLEVFEPLSDAEFIANFEALAAETCAITEPITCTGSQIPDEFHLPFITCAAAAPAIANRMSKRVSSSGKCAAFWLAQVHVKF